MTKTIKEVLANLTEHTEVSRYAVETGLKTPAENYENIQRKINHALSEIKKIMDGVIGEDEYVQPEFRDGLHRNELRTTQRQSLKEVLGE